MGSVACIVGRRNSAGMRKVGRGMTHRALLMVCAAIRPSTGGATSLPLTMSSDGTRGTHGTKRASRPAVSDGA